MPLTVEHEFRIRKMQALLANIALREGEYEMFVVFAFAFAMAGMDVPPKIEAKIDSLAKQRYKRQHRR